MKATREQGRQDHDASRTHGSTSLTGSIIFAPFFVHAPPSIFYVFFWFVKELSVIERTFFVSVAASRSVVIVRPARRG